jgi:hypothetical protein
VAESPFPALFPCSLLGVKVSLERRMWDRQNFFKSDFERSVFTLFILGGRFGVSH